MRLALEQAKKAAEAGEVPIGAVIVIGDRIITRDHNRTEMLKDVTAHSEILCLTSAFQAMGSKYLPDAALYVTIEPCLMCSGALYWSKIGKVVYGAPDLKNGYRRYTDMRNPFHPKTVLQTGLLENECSELMTAFFRKKRR